MKMFLCVMLSLALILCVSGPAFSQNDANSGDFSSIIQKGTELFNKAYYEEAEKEFIVVARSDEAPAEDRIKARYYLMKIYRAFDKNEKVDNEIREILKLSPGYALSNKEPSSLREQFEKVRNELFKKSEKDKTIEMSQNLRKDIVILEEKLSRVAGEQDSLSLRVKKQEEGTKRLKNTFFVSSLTMFILLAISIGFR